MYREITIKNAVFWVVFSILFFASVLPAFAETITWASSSNDLDNYGNTSQAKIAQPFTPSVNADTASVVFGVKPSGSPTDNVTIDIFADSAGLPSGSSLGGTSLPHGSIGSDCTTPITFPSITGLSLVGGTQYWVVFGRSGSQDGTNKYTYCGQDSTPGVFYYFLNNTTWTLGWGNIFKQIVLTSSGGGGGSTDGAFPNGSEVFPGQSASTTFSIVDNPTQDFFNGMVLFLMSFFGLIWIFKSRRKNN